MPVYDARCSCGWEGEIVSTFSQRDQQRCPEGCSEGLEFLIGKAAQTRFGFGFKPGLRMETGELVTVGKRRPATAQRGRG